MAYVDYAWYVNGGDGSTTGWWAVAKWAASTVYNCGDVIRQNTTPSVGSETILVCITGGTSNSGVEPTWSTARADFSTDGTATWTPDAGVAALCGDLTNTPDWNAVKNTLVSPGQVIKSNDASKLLICTVQGFTGSGSEPSWAAYTTAGATTTDNAATWKTLKSPASYAAWGAPHARINNPFGANYANVGDTVFVASTHTQTKTGSDSIDGTPSGPNNPIVLVSANTSAAPPGYAAGAQANVTGSSNFTILSQQCALYFQGFTFTNGGTGTIVLSNSFNSAVYFRECSFALTNATGSAQKFIIAPSGGVNGLRACFDNCSFSFANAFQQLAWGGFSQGETVLRACGFTGTAPSNLFGNLAPTLIEGCDLSLPTANVFQSGSGSQGPGVVVKDCKLGTGSLFPAAPAGLNRISVIRSDSSGTSYRSDTEDGYGAETTETTIVRTGGASDGTTSFSRKIVTRSNTSWSLPYSLMPITVWNDVVGYSNTVTVYGITNDTVVPNDDEVWIDVSYHGSDSSPVTSWATSSKASFIAANAALSSDSSTWGGSNTKFKMTATILPMQRGPVTVHVRVAKASATLYVDPKVVLS